MIAENSQQVVVALADPSVVVPHVLEYLAGIVGLAFCTPLLLYIAVRCVGRARAEGGAWWPAAALGLLTGVAALLGAVSLIKGFVDPGIFQDLARLAAAAFITVGSVLGCSVIWLVESRRRDGAFR